MNARVALALALLVLAPSAAAATSEYQMYLHDDPMHLVVDDASGNYVETLRAQPGDELRFTVHNDGSAPHRIIVCADAPDDSEDCARQLAFTPLLEPGESGPMALTASEEGTFDVYCNVPGHKGRVGSVGSMRVQLVVGDAAEGARDAPAPALAALVVALAVGALLRRR